MPSAKVIIVLKGYLGDAVMATPMLSSIVSSGSNVIVLSSPIVESLLASQYPSIEFRPTRNLSNPGELWKQAKEVRADCFDSAVVVNRSFRSALMARLAKIPVRVGHATEGRSWLLTTAVRYDDSEYESECYLQLSKAAGFEVCRRTPFLDFSESDKAAGAQLLEGATLGVQPGARHDWKQIPPAVLADAVNALESSGHKVALFGGPEEADMATQFESHLRHVPINLVGKIGVGQTAAVTANLRLAIGADTGFLHIAAASGCPTVTVFGPTDERKWGRREGCHRIVKAPHGNIGRVQASDLLEACRSLLGVPT